MSTMRWNMRARLISIQAPITMLSIHNPVHAEQAVDRNKPWNARLLEAGGWVRFPRRSFLKMAAGVAAGAIFGGSLSAYAAQVIQMPFENGRRKLVRFPQKGEMILLRERPPVLETLSRFSTKVSSRPMTSSSCDDICR